MTTDVLERPPILVTATEAERLYGIPASRVWLWAHRHMVEMVDYRHGRPAYHAHQLRTINRAANADPRSGKRGRRIRFDD